MPSVIYETNMTEKREGERALDSNYNIMTENTDELDY